MLNDLKELLSFESVLSKPEQNAPFGKNMRETLDWFLEKAESYGLKTGDLDGYCGFAEYGDGKEMIGILCHLDVVPAGNGWSCPPYSLTIEDGCLYGRGVVDNKGCAIIALNILKELKEKNIPLKNRIRLIAGCNEENGSACMKHYKTAGEIPKMSIVPDSDFPVINSEKGILHICASIPADNEFLMSVIKFEAGSRPNVVPDLCSVTIKKDSPIYEKLAAINCGKINNDIFKTPVLAKQIIGANFKPADFSVHIFEDNIVIEARGISGHAMSPHKADNAAYKMFSLLTALYGGKGGETIRSINKLLCEPLSLERLGLALKDGKSGALTMNLGIIKFENNSLDLTLDFRLPLCAGNVEVIKKLENSLPENSKVKLLHYAENLYIEENNPLIQTLLKVYHESTGFEPFTVQTGGGTYARELPHSVAFGPTFPDTVTNIHNVDERISIEQFEKLYEIYYKAILELDKL